MEQRESLQQMVPEQLDTQMEKKINLETDLTPFTKINPRRITDPKVKCKTLKLLEDDIGENLDGFGCGENFLDTNNIKDTLHKRK